MVEIAVNYSSFEKHNTQIFTGLKLLSDAGVIRVKCKLLKNGIYARKDLPVILLSVFNKKIIIDVSDGYRFDHSISIQDNLILLDKMLEECDYYFKRSYKNTFVAKLKNFDKMQCLGLNYPMTNLLLNEDSKSFSNDNIKRALAKIPILKSMLHLSGRSDTSFKSFENSPHSLERIANKPSILFLTRAWDPYELPLPDDLIQERLLMNNHRANCIRKCKEKFGDCFIGGFQSTDYAIKHFPDITIPRKLTNRASFLKILKNATICIATTGLHNSIGWKMGEYVAASKAIVTEPLFYEVDSYFREGNNYLTFDNEEMLSQVLDNLIQNPLLVKNMMDSNQKYYDHYLRPDRLIFNLLRTSQVI